MRHDFLHHPPRSVCIVRLSALGDVCHVLAVVRSLQRAWPDTRFTWIIGAPEHRLLGLASDIEFITVDKRGGAHAVAALRARLAGRNFDLCLHMQIALRASLLTLWVRSPVKLGFDRARAREGQWLFTNDRIAPAPRVHVLDGLFGFAAALGVERGALGWNLPVPPAALDYAQRLIPDQRPTLTISACSSHSARNWRPERYAALADYADQRGHRVLLVGGPSAAERQMADAILAHTRSSPIDQVGKDTLPELLAVLARSDVLLTPDSGPAHMATMVGTPVIGLYAATNPARSGPYLSREWCVDRYPLAAQRFLGRAVDELPWTTKIERPGVMDLIEVRDVCEQFDRLVRAGRRVRAGAAAC
jgi:heptosyltransferase I